MSTETNRIPLVPLSVRFRDARATVRDILGSRYVDVIAPLRDAIRDAARNIGPQCSPIVAALAMMKGASRGDRLIYLAAIADLADAEEAKRETA